MTKPTRQFSSVEIANSIGLWMIEQWKAGAENAIRMSAGLPMVSFERSTSLFLLIKEAIDAERKIQEELREDVGERIIEVHSLIEQLALKDKILDKAVEALKPLVAVEKTGILTPQMFIDAKEHLREIQEMRGGL